MGYVAIKGGETAIREAARVAPRSQSTPSVISFTS